MNHVAKIIEVVGTSEKSIEDAIESAVQHASTTLDNLQWFQVVETRGALKDAKVERYQVLLKIAFGLE